MGERAFDPEMTADPEGFTNRKLNDLRALLEDNGAGDLVSSVDFDEYERALPLIRQAIEACLAGPQPQQ